MLYITMIPGMGTNDVSFIRKSFYIFARHITWSAERDGHNEKHTLEPIFVHFLASNGILFNPAIIKCDHNGIRWKLLAGKQIIIQLIRQYGMIAVLSKKFHLLLEVGKRHDIVFCSPGIGRFPIPNLVITKNGNLRAI